jgi:hypothetical protein
VYVLQYPQGARAGAHLIFGVKFIALVVGGRRRKAEDERPPKRLNGPARTISAQMMSPGAADDKAEISAATNELISL